MEKIRIEHIDDVVPHIPPDRGIIVSSRPDHTVIDYVFTVDDTFATAIARECRGLKFGPDGRIIARPFHKFFNLGEKERVEEIDWSAPHGVFDKLDGSMIHPAMLNGEMVFMTRMGATEQARLAGAYAGPGALALSKHFLDAGMTPIFEFTSPDNRIVVLYDRPALTLLAVREMISGAYVPHDELAEIAARHEVPVAQDLGRLHDAKSFVADARGRPGIEGYVVAFATGHRLKLKTDGYALRHKALSSLHFEKNILAWVATGAVDDVVPILAPELGQRVLDYQTQVQGAITSLAAGISAFVETNRGSGRKDFAAKVMAEVDPRLRGATFSALDGKDARATVTQLLVAASHSDTRVDAVRDLFGMEWRTDDIALPDLEG